MRHAVWVLPLIWLALPWASVATVWVVTYHTPPNWDTHDFLRVRVRLHEVVRPQPLRPTRAGGWVMGSGYVSAYVAAMLQCVLMIVRAGGVAWQHM